MLADCSFDRVILANDKEKKHNNKNNNSNKNNNNNNSNNKFCDIKCRRIFLGVVINNVCVQDVSKTPRRCKTAQNNGSELVIFRQSEGH